VSATSRWTTVLVCVAGSGAAALVVILVATSYGDEASIASTSAHVRPLDARHSPYVLGNLSPPLRGGRQGRIVVIAIGNYGPSGDAGDFLGDVTLVLPVVIRNNTNVVLHGDISLSAEAETPAGTVISSSEPRNVYPLYPTTVNPGEIAIGHVYFDNRLLPAKTTFTVAAKRDGDVESPFTDLAIHYPARRDGAFIRVTARNSTPFTFGGRGHANLLCFTKTGSLLRYYSSSTDLWRFKPGVHARFSVGPVGRCPVYLVTAVARARIEKNEP
jgi:hypothetical protein